jgi:hypothetical protein
VRAAIAIGCALAVLAGCGGEVTAAPQREASGGGGAADAAAMACPVDGPPAPNVQMAPDAQTAPDRYPAATCAARGAKCVVTSDTCEAVFGDVDCGPGMSCCVYETCKPDAAPWLIQASNYNVSCSVDSDCVAVGGFGDACRRCFCLSAAINRSSQAQYNADFAKSPAVSCFSCPLPPLAPCCVCGVCRLDDNLCHPPP